jgi:hypothetical protein
LPTARPCTWHVRRKIKPQPRLNPRWCLHSEAAFECCDEIQEASVISCEFIVSCVAAAEVFDLAEEALDQVAVLVDCGIEARPTGGCGSTRDNRLRSRCCDGVHGALAIVAFVSQHMARRQTFEQPLDLGGVIAFPAGQNEADGIAERIGGGMNLGAQAAF